MEKISEMVVKMASAGQKKPPLPSQIAHIEQQLQIAFPTRLHTPNHPAYPAMIYRAITELNEEGGSSEESISEYIKAKYKELPWAHKSFLNLHLSKLSSKGFLVFTADKRFLIPSLAAMTVGYGKSRLIKRKHSSMVAGDDSIEKEEAEGTGGNERNKARRRLAFDMENEDALCNAINTKLSLQRGIHDLNNIWLGEKQIRDGTQTNLVIHKHAIDGADLKKIPNKGKPSKGFVQRMKKGTAEGKLKKGMAEQKMERVIVFALSGRPMKHPDQVERRQRAAPVKRRQEEPTGSMLPFHSTFIKQENLEGILADVVQEKKNADHRERKQPLELQLFVWTSFFGHCMAHPDADNSKCHSYCMDCMSGALCSSCLFSHRDHDIVRVSRTMWEDAVPESRIKMFMDISGIQTHFVTGRHMISLKRTNGSRQRKHFSGVCKVCMRHLPGSFMFCSLACKIVHELSGCTPSENNQVVTQSWDADADYT